MPDPLWELIFDEEHHQRLLRELIPAAQKFVWIATADLKDMHVMVRKGKYRSFLSVLAELVENGIEIRLLHAKEPGPRFREEFDRLPALQSQGFERLLCPRLHMKLIIVDGTAAYLGSANFTGAGLGPRSEIRRNFECGTITRCPQAVARLMHQFDNLFLGSPCAKCDYRKRCPDPIDG
jgi:phosphatidylserine/phosphatidylglycerophosphate/cardiolipin synthase-like enzyme